MLVSSFNLTKNCSNQRSFLSVYRPWILCCTRAALAGGAHTAEFGIISTETELEFLKNLWGLGTE
jgi:hypothetical protein